MHPAPERPEVHTFEIPKTDFTQQEVELSTGSPNSRSKWFSVNLSLSSSACTKVYNSLIWSESLGLPVQDQYSEMWLLYPETSWASESSAGNFTCFRQEKDEAKAHFNLLFGARGVEKNVKSKFMRFDQRHPVRRDTVAVSSKSMCPWQWSDQKIEIRKWSVIEVKHGSSVSKFFQVHSWIFSRKTKFTKPQSQTKRSDIPWLS